LVVVVPPGFVVVVGLVVVVFVPNILSAKVFAATPAPAPAKALVNVFARPDVLAVALLGVFVNVGLVAPVNLVVIVEPAAGFVAEPPSVGFVVALPKGAVDFLIALVSAVDGRVDVFALEVNAGLVAGTPAVPPPTGRVPPPASTEPPVGREPETPKSIPPGCPLISLVRRSLGRPETRTPRSL
jgi:hypothetical protein